jgi:catechol 2,3-dioxygenase-like lactoylglutathione lyase family enzyme
LSSISVRYIVHDVDAAIDFYCGQLGFTEVVHPAPSFAILSLGDLRLLLSSPSSEGGGGRRLADGSTPEPGGWNRFTLEVADVSAEIARLSHAGVSLRSELIDGVGGRQVLIEDPSGNLVELFQPTRPDARL